MAKSVNKVILVGRLGRDPELKYTASGVPFCRFSMATDDVWNDKASGERQERTEWHNIVAWDRLAGVNAVPPTLRPVPRSLQLQHPPARLPTTIFPSSMARNPSLYRQGGLQG